MITEYGLANRDHRIEPVMLGQVPADQAARLRDPAGVRGRDPDDHVDQGGLAVAVAAYDADPVPGGDAETDAVEHAPEAVRDRRPFDAHEVGRRSGRHDLPTVSV